jgi:hypothetical protein
MTCGWWSSFVKCRHVRRAPHWAWVAMPRMMSVRALERRVSEGIDGGGDVLICFRSAGIEVDITQQAQLVLWSGSGSGSKRIGAGK